jgi:hypothetical protein
MNAWLENSYLWLALVLLVAGSIPVLSVMMLTRHENKLLANPPTEALEQLLKDGFAPEHLLVGVPHSTWMQAALLLRDSRFQALGRVVYGWRDRIRIELNGRIYQIEEIRAPLLETRLTLDGEVFASSQSGLLGTEPSRFDVPGNGPLTVEASLGSFLRSDYSIRSAGEIVGRVMDTGKRSKGHPVLALKGGYSAPMRAYILALKYRSMT